MFKLSVFVIVENQIQFFLEFGFLAGAGEGHEDYLLTGLQ